MTKKTTPAAAAQPLVSFSFNLPADVAKRFLEIVADQAEGAGAPRSAGQLAALAVASFMESCDSGAHTIPCPGIQAAAFEANAAGVEAESINVTLLADDMDFLVSGEEERLRYDTGASEELAGTALTDYVESITAPDDEYQKDLVARTRRLLAARGAVAVSAGGCSRE